LYYHNNNALYLKISFLRAPRYPSTFFQKNHTSYKLTVKIFLSQSSEYNGSRRYDGRRVKINVFCIGTTHNPIKIIIMLFIIVWWCVKIEWYFFSFNADGAENYDRRPWPNTTGRPRHVSRSRRRFPFFSLQNTPSYDIILLLFARNSLTTTPYIYTQPVDAIVKSRNPRASFFTRPLRSMILLLLLLLLLLLYYI